jgi:hypothetical protein
MSVRRPARTCVLTVPQGPDHVSVATAEEPGKAFNSRVRAECMNAHWFLTLADAREKLEAWWNCYNEALPLGTIGNKVPISLQKPGDAASPSP